MPNRKKVAPIYVFDEHNEAYYYWHKAKYEGYINEPLDLFHIDAHSDMVKAEYIQTSIYLPSDSQISYLEYYENIAKNEFNIGDFIIPAILNKLVRNVYFIFPKWRKYKAIRKRCNISSLFGEGKLFKHCLPVNKNTNPNILKVFPDFKQYNYSFLQVDSVPKNRKVILDIDLDYFACNDSSHTFELEITEEQFYKQKIFLQDETLQFARMDFRFITKGERFYARIATKKGKHESKSHLPSRPQIVSEIDRLITTLKVRKIRPLVVTISRSCISGFCPKDYAEFIETELLQRLLLLLGN